MTDAGRHRVVGLGGVFLRAKDPAALAAWYRDRLGLDVQDFGGGGFGVMFPLEAGDGYQLLSVFPPDTTSLGDASQPVMLNFRVADLDGLLAQLRADGADVDDRVERSEYGDFGWCTDAEGNRVELWQPPAA